VTASKLAVAHRLAWVDYARAIGIILVVLGHGNRGINRTAGLTWGEGYVLLDQFIYAFHMPIFFVLAGYISSKTSGQDFAKFAKGLWWGIILPYFLWSLIWVTMKTSFPGATNTSVGWTALTTMLWAPIEHFWFLYHLFFIRLFWYAAQGAVTRSMQLALLAVAVVLSVVLDLLGPQFGTFSYLGFNLFMYGLGALILPALLSKLAAQGSQLMTAGLAAACLVAAVLIIHQLPDLDGTMEFSGLSPRLLRQILVLVAAIAGVFMTVNLVQLLPQPGPAPWRIFAYLGEASLAIYLTHTIVMAMLRGILIKAGFTSSIGILCLTTIAGLALPAVAYYVILRMGAFANMPLGKYAGLGQGTRSNYLT
jgi:fucose 4-O-acetylase-like acetyltransferase